MSPKRSFSAARSDARAVFVGSRDNEAVLEVGARMRRREVVRDLPIDERHLLQRELAHVAPRVSELGLVEVAPVLADDPPRLVRRLLRSATQT